MEINSNDGLVWCNCNYKCSKTKEGRVRVSKATRTRHRKIDLTAPITSGEDESSDETTSSNLLSTSTEEITSIMRNSEKKRKIPEIEELRYN